MKIKGLDRKPKRPSRVGLRVADAVIRIENIIAKTEC